jgi:transcriptional regulator with XRE-family HTH domain
MAHSLFLVSNLAEVRNNIPLTQQELAAKSGLAVKTISDIETKPDHAIRFRTLGKLKKGLNGHASKLKVRQLA